MYTFQSQSKPLKGSEMKIALHRILICVVPFKIFLSTGAHETPHLEQENNR